MRRHVSYKRFWRNFTLFRPIAFNAAHTNCTIRKKIVCSRKRTREARHLIINSFSGEMEQQFKVHCFNKGKSPSWDKPRDTWAEAWNLMNRLFVRFEEFSFVVTRHSSKLMFHRRAHLFIFSATQHTRVNLKCHRTLLKCQIDWQCAVFICVSKLCSFNVFLSRLSFAYARTYAVYEKYIIICFFVVQHFLFQSIADISVLRIIDWRRHFHNYSFCM